MAQFNKAPSAPRAINSQHDYDLAKREFYREKQQSQGLGQIVNAGEINSVPEAEDDEQGAKRQLYKDKQQAVRAPLNIPGSTSRNEEEKESIDQTSGQLALEEQQGGIAGALARQRQKNTVRREQADKAKLGLAAGEVGLEEANAIILGAYKGIWSAAHEFLEDAALSFVDLMIFTGPLCIAFFLIRFIGMMSIGKLFTIKFKGMEIPIVPMFNTGEIPIRVGKTILIAIIAGVIWGAILLFIWMIVDPVGASGFISKNIVNTFLQEAGKPVI